MVPPEKNPNFDLFLPDFPNFSANLGIPTLASIIPSTVSEPEPREPGELGEPEPGEPREPGGLEPLEQREPGEPEPREPEYNQNGIVASCECNRTGGFLNLVSHWGPPPKQTEAMQCFFVHGGLRCKLGDGHGSISRVRGRVAFFAFATLATLANSRLCSHLLLCSLLCLFDFAVNLTMGIACY